MKADLSDLLTHCIHCGFCLEACPTFALTGNELESPRGRIYLVRSALEGQLNWADDVKPHLDLCLGCRACEPACPSGVQYGAILEIARDEVERQRPSWPKSAILESTTHPGLLKVQLTASRFLGMKRMPSLLSRQLSTDPAEANFPQPQPAHSLPPLDDSQCSPLVGEVYFLEGCAMSLLHARVHESAKRLLRRIGFRVRDVKQGCCGALHSHNGHLKEAERLGDSLMGAFSDPLPVVVDSAGCGSAMKEYPGEFSSRVFDLSEFLYTHGLEERLDKSPGLDLRIAYHEACHLVHGQRVTEAPNRLLRSIPRTTIVDLPEATMCCGSAGIYNVLQPKMARELLDRKWGNVIESQAQVVATGNPGCHSWIAQASGEQGSQIPVLHTAELLEASFIGLNPFLK